MLQRIKAGTLAGLAAGIAVAVVILVYDLATLDPLGTPKRLAGNVLGVPHPIETADGLSALAWVASVMTTAWAVVLYTAVHFAVFALVGIGAAFVFPSLVRGTVATGALYGALAGSAVFYAGLALLAPGFLSVPDWRLALAANALAGVVMVSQLVDVREPSS